MARYKISINTVGYVPMRYSKQNWEPGTINLFMQALKGWSVTETSLKMVRVRLGIFTGTEAGCQLMDNYYEWKNSPDSKAYITFYDYVCGFDRTLEVRPYGFTQGSVNIEEKIKELREKGVTRVYFKEVYDIRQYNKAFDRCYMEIKKEG